MDNYMAYRVILAEGRLIEKFSRLTAGHARLSHPHALNDHFVYQKYKSLSI